MRPAHAAPVTVSNASKDLADGASREGDDAVEGSSVMLGRSARSTASAASAAISDVLLPVMHAIAATYIASTIRAGPRTASQMKGTDKASGSP